MVRGFMRLIVFRWLKFGPALSGSVPRRPIGKTSAMPIRRHFAKPYRTEATGSAEFARGGGAALFGLQLLEPFVDFRLSAARPYLGPIRSNMTAERISGRTFDWRYESGRPARSGRGKWRMTGAATQAGSIFEKGTARPLRELFSMLQQQDFASLRCSGRSGTRREQAIL